jgi:glycosyltransferase involved in cell wall biosynthesis
MTYAPSPSARSELIAQGIKEVELWQRGIDLKNFSPRFRDYQLRNSIEAENKPVLLFVGRLVKEKDLDDLVRASSILQGWGDPFKLVIIGDGPMRKELEEKLPNAHFTGYLKGEPLSRWYASSDIFVFPSTTETFGNVVMEAFASGLPVIGVNKGGVADLISSGKNGLLSPANNPVDLAFNIKMLLNNTALRNYMSNQAQQYANQHSWDAINGKLMSSYNEILNNFYSLN